MKNAAKRFVRRLKNTAIPRIDAKEQELSYKNQRPSRLGSIATGINPVFHQCELIHV